MSLENEIFAQSSSNILSDGDYQIDTERKNGFQSGTPIKSKTMNTVLKKCTETRAGMLDGLGIPNGAYATVVSKMTKLKTVIDGPFVKALSTSDWQGSTAPFSYTINATTHKQGQYPTVQTFVNNEESYDSPKIDENGNVTVYTNYKIAMRVVIKP